MAIETPLWMDPAPGEVTGPPTSALQDRAIIASLFTEGVHDVGAGDLRVTPRSSGAGLSVEVAPGAGYVAGDDVPRQGTYRCVSSATELVEIAGAPASGSRIDLVVLRVYDPALIGGARQGAALEVVEGAAASNPTPPPLPRTAIALARVRLAAGQASVVASQITDLREQSGANTLRVGTSATAGTTAQRDAQSNPLVGQLWENTSLGRLEHFSVSGWKPASSPTVAVSKTVTTTAVPRSGSVVFQVPLGVSLDNVSLMVSGPAGGGFFATAGATEDQTFGVEYQDRLLGESRMFHGSKMSANITPSGSKSIAINGAWISGQTLWLRLSAGQNGGDPVEITVAAQGVIA